jgi:pimeloyl-ACP methyl ester carboxylesterase
MAKISVNGVGLHVRQLGKGADVVFLHGLAANQAFWRFDLLHELATRYRVTVFDQRGHGYSDTPAAGYTVAHMANDLEGVLDVLGIARAHVVGHSYGGAVALQHAVDHPERVLSLTIADTRIWSLQPALRPQDFHHGKLWWKHFRDAGIEIGDGQSLDFAIFDVFANPRWKELGQQLFGHGFFVPFGGWNGAQRSAKRWRDLLDQTTARRDFLRPHGPAVEDIRALRVPVLAFYGEHSHCMPSAHGLMQNLKNCQLVICPQSGHFFPSLQPKRFARVIGRLLAEVDDRKRQLLEVRHLIVAAAPQNATQAEGPETPRALGSDV